MDFFLRKVLGICRFCICCLGLSFLPLLFSFEGLQYTHFNTLSSKQIPSFMQKNQSVHVIEIDPKLYKIRPVKALDDGIGTETVLSMNTRNSGLACINGGFFTMGSNFDGEVRGALKIHGWYGLPIKPRGCIGWSEKDQRPKMDRILVKVYGHYQDKHFAVDGLNRERKEGEMILFNPYFHRTTVTNPDGEELIIIDGMIQEVRRKGSSKIPENGYVLSIQKKSSFFDFFKKGEKISFSKDIKPLEGFTSVNDWQLCDFIVGGTPLLLYKNKKILDFKPEQTILTFLTDKHARTAIGILPNGHWLFVVVEQTDLFEGMTMYELSNLMVGLGCMDALNLDGGGSSTMVFEGKAMNSPYNETLKLNVVRKVSNAIVVTEKKEK